MEQQLEQSMDVVAQATSEVADILRPMYIKPPTGSILEQFTLAGAKTKPGDIKDKIVDEVIGTVCTDDLNIPVYILSRLVCDRTLSQDIASVKVDFFSLISQISGKSITKRSDLPAFGKWLVAKHPSLVRKATAIRGIF